MPTISKHATVETSNIAKDVVIGAFSRIGPDVRIAAGTIIEDHVIVMGRTSIGRDNHLFPGVVIGPAEGEDPKSRIKIGEANSLREQVIISGTSKGPTRLGNDCLIMIACQVGPAAAVGNHVVLANRTMVASGATLKDYVRSSGFALVDVGSTVGDYSFISPYTRVVGQAPPFAQLEGDPFRVRGVNTPLLQRCGFGEDDVRALKGAYRELYNGNRREPNPQIMAHLLADKGLNARVRQAIEPLAKEIARG
jgi:UDP-N-acetylglucosamine acyltransferase